MIGQLGLPDMRIPIQYAMTWPYRAPCPAGELSLAQLGKLTFFEPDGETFPGVDIFRRALAAGGTAPAAVNAANEQAVAMFLAGKLGFLDISRRAERILTYAWPRADGVEAVLAADREARGLTEKG